MNIQLIKRGRQCILLICLIVMATWHTDVFAQQSGTTKAISGVVTDLEGEPLIGANVVVKNDPSTGTITDLDGNFTLQAPAQGILVVSYIGYQPQEIAIAGKTIFQISLSENANTLDDIYCSSRLWSDEKERCYKFRNNNQSGKYD
ncbi:MAG: carboxypeptidase-like regulatory domain-containing protein [Tannerellaceae bacterium]|nr:carboxypeptidase-like regulatory domain-containing protein [Tannerellaceae bacterium]